jgi:hypothetical protein
LLPDRVRADIGAATIPVLHDRVTVTLARNDRASFLQRGTNPISEHMSNSSPQEIASSLTPEQREMVMIGPINWRQADTLPEGLFEYDEIYDSETAQEIGTWQLTDLGKQVYALVASQDRSI